MSGSGSGDASEVCIAGTFGRNGCPFRYGEFAMDASALAEAATLPTGAVWTFGRNGCPFRYGEFAMDASAVAEAATLPTGVVWTIGRNGSPFRYG